MPPIFNALTLTFWHAKGYLQSGRNEEFKEMLTGSPALPRPKPPLTFHTQFFRFLDYLRAWNRLQEVKMIHLTANINPPLWPTLGDRLFACAALKLWNALPFEVRDKSWDIFKTNLKMHLFHLAFSQSESWKCNIRDWNFNNSDNIFIVFSFM